MEEHQVLLSQIGPTAIPIPAPSTSILIPPLGGGTSAVNTPAGSITVSTDTISQEMEATLASSILQMAEHKKNARPSTQGKYEKGQARKQQDQQGAKGMKDPPRKSPRDTKAMAAKEE